MPPRVLGRGIPFPFIDGYQLHNLYFHHALGRIACSNGASNYISNILALPLMFIFFSVSCLLSFALRHLLNNFLHGLLPLWGLFIVPLFVCDVFRQSSIIYQPIDCILELYAISGVVPMTLIKTKNVWTCMSMRTP